MEPIRYAKNGDVHLAYQVVGEGELDIVWVPGWFSDLETMWDVPGFGRFLRELSSIGRVVLFDKRGMGQSDRTLPDGYPPIQDWVEDVVAVMDEAGVEQAELVGLSEGGSQALLTAARHPDRVRSVTAINPWVRILRRDDDPDLGIDLEDLRTFVSRAVQNWGTGRDIAVFAPSQQGDPLFRERWSNFQRRAASPSAIGGYGEALHLLDIRDDLSEVSAPVLLLYSEGDRMVPNSQFRYVADHVSEVRSVSLPGRDHVPFFDAPELLLEEIERHLLGHVRSARVSRRFAAILFADIVASTDRAATMGDGPWRSLLDAYERLVERCVDEHGGTVVKSTGDGTLATFVDPETALLAAGHLQREVRGLGLEIRAGLHFGQVEVRGDDVGGIAVHIASRVAGRADPGSTVVSSTVREALLGSTFAFTSLGAVELKGVPGEWTVHRLD